MKIISTKTFGYTINIINVETISNAVYFVTHTHTCLGLCKYYETINTYYVAFPWSLGFTVEFFYFIRHATTKTSSYISFHASQYYHLPRLLRSLLIHMTFSYPVYVDECYTPRLSTIQPVIISYQSKIFDYYVSRKYDRTESDYKYPVKLKQLN